MPVQYLANLAACWNLAQDMQSMEWQLSLGILLCWGIDQYWKAAHYIPVSGCSYGIEMFARDDYSGPESRLVNNNEENLITYRNVFWESIIGFVM